QPPPTLFPYTTLFRSGGKTSHDGVPSQQVLQTLVVCDIADGHHLYIVAVVQDAEHVASDAAEAHQANTNCHPVSPCLTCEGLSRSEEHTSELQSRENL